MGEDKKKKHLVLEKEVWDEVMRLKLDWDMDSGSDVVKKLIYEKNLEVPRYKILREIKESIKELSEKIDE